MNVVVTLLNIQTVREREIKKTWKNNLVDLWMFHFTIRTIFIHTTCKN